MVIYSTKCCKLKDNRTYEIVELKEVDLSPRKKTKTLIKINY